MPAPLSSYQPVPIPSHCFLQGFFLLPLPSPAHYYYDFILMQKRFHKRPFSLPRGAGPAPASLECSPAAAASRCCGPSRRGLCRTVPCTLPCSSPGDAQQAPLTPAQPQLQGQGWGEMHNSPQWDTLVPQPGRVHAQSSSAVGMRKFADYKCTSGWKREKTGVPVVLFPCPEGLSDV